MSNFTAWVLRSSMAGFTAGCIALQQEAPHFGDLVKIQQDSFQSLGLIYDVKVNDDLVVRQLILANMLEPELVLDQRENRLAPIEINVLMVGWRADQKMSRGLPPQPPVCLDMVTICDETELRIFSADLTYLRLVLNASGVPADELLATHLKRAAGCRAIEARYPFLLSAGRELAYLLSADLIRLDSILKRIRPERGL